MTPTDEALVPPAGQPTTELVPADQMLATVDISDDQSIEILSQIIRNSAYVFSEDDAMLMADASTFQPTDQVSYNDGLQTLNELKTLDESIVATYERYASALNRLGKVVTECRKPQRDEVATIKDGLSRRLGAWDAARIKREREEREAAQREADRKAREEQQAKADAIAATAQTVADPVVRASIQAQARAVAAVEVRGATVELPTAKKSTAGYSKTKYLCSFDNIKELLKAHVEGRCTLPEDKIIAALQSFMNVQADQYGDRLSKAFPGCTAVPDTKAVGNRRK